MTNSSKWRPAFVTVTAGAAVTVTAGAALVLTACGAQPVTNNPPPPPATTEVHHNPPPPPATTEVHHNPPPPPPATSKPPPPPTAEVHHNPPPLPRWEDVPSGHPAGATNPPYPVLLLKADGTCFKAWQAAMAPRKSDTQAMDLKGIRYRVRILAEADNGGARATQILCPPGAAEALASSKR